MAQSQPQSQADGDARTAFTRGTELVQNAQWAEALAAFERASELRPHPITTYNIAACERAMGRYTRAYRTFSRALKENDATGATALPESLATEARGYLGELDRILVRLTLEVTPEGSQVTVDGRPLDATSAPDRGVESMAGIRPPGPGDPSPLGAFVVVLAPGVHVLTFARPGFEDAVVHRTFAPGRTLSQRIELAQLPASLRISSNRSGSIVRVAGTDVGPAPVEVLRPPGSYTVSVQKEGFVPYEARVRLRPGEQMDLHATLVEHSTAITGRWWFWTGAAILVGGAIAGTYALTRGSHRDSVPDGSLGWGAVVP